MRIHKNKKSLGHAAKHFYNAILDKGFDVIAFQSKSRSSSYYRISKGDFLALVRLSTHPPGRNWDKYMTSHGKANVYGLVHPGSKHTIEQILHKVEEGYNRIYNPDTITTRKLLIAIDKVTDIPMGWWICVDVDGMILTSPDEPVVSLETGLPRWVGNWVAGYVSRGIKLEGLVTVTEEYKWKRVAKTNESFDTDFFSKAQIDLIDKIS